MSSSTHSAKQEGPGRKDGREVEWQLASTDLGPVRRWLADHGTIGGLVLEPRSTQQIFDTYLDTDDWRIHRAGFALRIRSESGKAEATLKSLHSASAEVADRRDLSETLENSASDRAGRNACTGREGFARLAAFVRSTHLEAEIRGPQRGRGATIGRDCTR